MNDFIIFVSVSFLLHTLSEQRSAHTISVYYVLKIIFLFLIHALFRLYHVFSLNYMCLYSSQVSVLSSNFGYKHMGLEQSKILL